LEFDLAPDESGAFLRKTLVVSITKKIEKLSKKPPAMAGGQRLFVDVTAVTTDKRISA